MIRLGEAPKLRPYQERGVEGVRALYRQGHRRVLLNAPTGSGKTVLFCHIVAAATAKDQRCLILAHRRELIDQTSAKLNAYGVRHGIIQGTRPVAPHLPVQVASVQTLVRRPQAMSRVDLLVIDEAHHVTPNNSYAQILERYPRAWLLGVTATPWRLDGQGLADVFPHHVIVATPEELRDQGYLCPVGGWTYEAIDTSQVELSRGDYSQSQLAQAVRASGAVAGNVVQEWLAHAAGLRSILFACSIDHSKEMASRFVAAGVPAEHLDGTTPGTERDAILRRLHEGRTLVVCNCGVITEGFDCPSAEVALLCRPTMSRALYLQMVGRVLRPSPGKSVARIHDHGELLRQHGHPYEPRDWSPEHGAPASREPVEARIREESRCPQCGSVLARWPCDACGHAPTEKERADRYAFIEAVRKPIEEGGATPKARLQAMAQQWRAKYAGKPERKRAVWDRFVERHGAKGIGRVIGVYGWFTGHTESPPREWIQDGARKLKLMAELTGGTHGADTQAAGEDGRPSRFVEVGAPEAAQG